MSHCRHSAVFIQLYGGHPPRQNFSCLVLWYYDRLLERENFEEFHDTKWSPDSAVLNPLFLSLLLSLSFYLSLSLSYYPSLTASLSLSVCLSLSISLSLSLSLCFFLSLCLSLSLYLSLFLSSSHSVSFCFIKSLGARPWRYVFALVSLPLSLSSIVYFINHRYALYFSSYLIYSFLISNKNKIGVMLDSLIKVNETDSDSICDIDNPFSNLCLYFYNF